MERLPYIDTHAREITAPPEVVWDALVETMARTWGGTTPPPLAAVLANEPRVRTGRWRGATIEPGDTIPGFAVAAAVPSRRLALTGRHRFSTYALTFTLHTTDDGGTLLAARTDAAFPGLRGRGYRALVIGSRGHVVAVRRMLAQVARRSG